MMEYTEDYVVYVCSVCGHKEICAADEQMFDYCEECEHINDTELNKLLKE